MTRVAWGALLQGASEDIADWTEVLKPGFDHPWIETHGADTVLRSPVLDGLETASEVHHMAGALIDVLKGAVALSQGAGPLKCTGVAELSSDGKLHKHVFASMHIELGRFRMHAVGVALGPDGKPLPPPPAQPSAVQNWSATAQSDGLIEDALIYYGRATDWFDIYKALECLILKFGGAGSDGKREKTFKELGWAPKKRNL